MNVRCRAGKALRGCSSCIPRMPARTKLRTFRWRAAHHRCTIPPKLDQYRATTRRSEASENGARVMANLYELVDEAHNGESLAELGREFQLTPQQTEAAVTALLPAISAGLKQSTATFDGLGNLLAMMGQQPHLQSLYDDPEAALGAQGAAAGNDVLSTIFGSPAVTQGVIDHAQQFSGVNSGILKKLLPVLAGIVISGLMRSGSKPAAPQSPAP